MSDDLTAYEVYAELVDLVAQRETGTVDETLIAELKQLLNYKRLGNTQRRWQNTQGEFYSPYEGV